MFQGERRRIALQSGGRYKELMRDCPYQGLENWLIIHIFYYGMLYNIIKLHNNVAVGRALMSNPFHDAYTLIKNMAQNHYQLGSECTPIEKTQPR